MEGGESFEDVWSLAGRFRSFDDEDEEEETITSRVEPELTTVRGGELGLLLKRLKTRRKKNEPFYLLK